MTHPESDRPEVTPRSLAEWISFTIASIILSIVVVLVIYSWATIQDKPPILNVKTDSDIRQVEGQFYLPIEVTNSGGGTVEAVEVLAELSIEGKTVETGQIQINFLSAGEVRFGTFIFTRNPALGKLSVRVVSYKLP